METIELPVGKEGIFSYNEYGKGETKAMRTRPAHIRYHMRSGLFEARCYSMCMGMTNTWKRLRADDLLAERDDSSPFGWGMYDFGIEGIGDAFGDLLALRSEFHVSRSVLKEAMKQAHRYRLGRCDSPWIELKPKDYSGRIGRKRAARKAEPSNLANSEAILGKSAARGDIDAFMSMCKDMGMGKQKAMDTWKEMRSR